MRAARATLSIKLNLISIFWRCRCPRRSYFSYKAPSEKQKERRGGNSQ